MFLRRCQRRKDGKRHVYWALVESVRTPQGPRQRVVSYLGELRPTEQSGWARLGPRMAERERPQPSLFDVTPVDELAERELLTVRVKDVQLERTRDFGDVWMAWGLWRLAGLDHLLSEKIPPGREEVPWPITAAILTIARFCEPGSELWIEEKWYPRTALDDLLGVPASKVHTDRLYAGLDKVLPLKEEIEKHLKKRLGDLFDLRYDLLLYDVTSTYFEGQGRGNHLARRGYSRDNRPDCPQVCIGLVVTADGIPLAYEVNAGNTTDSTTVKGIVEAMEAKHGKADRVWVMDRGMVSQDNIEFLRSRGARYIVGTPRAMLRRFERHLTDQDWTQVRPGVRVKIVPDPSGGQELYLLAQSEDRGRKEHAMHEKFAARVLAGLEAMKAAAEKGRLRTVGEAERRLGRLLERNWRASRAFSVTIEPVERSPSSSGGVFITVTWTPNKEWAGQAAAGEGCYLLRTNLTDTDPAELWKRYIQLTEAEAAFRVHKDELRLRPIWHQTADRVQAHILICFLAYVLWKTLAQLMRRAGLGDAPRTLIEELARIKSGDVVLPCRMADGEDRRVRLRCVSNPDPAQAVLLNRLGIRLPRRLRSNQEVVPALTPQEVSL